MVKAKNKTMVLAPLRVTLFYLIILNITKNGLRILFKLGYMCSKTLNTFLILSTTKSSYKESFHWDVFLLVFTLLMKNKTQTRSKVFHHQIILININSFTIFAKCLCVSAGCIIQHDLWFQLWKSISVLKQQWLFKVLKVLMLSWGESWR